MATKQITWKCLKCGISGNIAYGEHYDDCSQQ